MNNQFKQHGAFSWAELMVDEPEKALAFYKDVIGWDVEEMPMSTGTYYVFKADGQPVGGLMAKPQEASHVPNHWGVYVTVDDVDATLSQVEIAGGKAVFAPMDVPGVGRLCSFMDNCGSVLSIISYEDKKV
ncbi:VOC family protein [Photobacterium profundum]|uniref:VOC domain-containing protein n=1 Tax=Photobacterium profundum 3TCK TaxID=314280 RepID=Q1YX29_9GAMM|nr:VOC family protein [Photobacterium profundum]EAS40853.1 hypothetical protein P3TCK_09288 [Photobacterium profundum 3TCK]PSV62371.1 VOC family protein [Photobacterium profundum]